MGSAEIQAANDERRSPNGALAVRATFGTPMNEEYAGHAINFMGTLWSGLVDATHGGSMICLSTIQHQLLSSTSPFTNPVPETADLGLGQTPNTSYASNLKPLKSRATKP